MMETIGPHKGFYGLLVRKVEGPSFLRMLASNFFIFSSETIRFGLSSPSAMVAAPAIVAVAGYGGTATIVAGP